MKNEWDLAESTKWNFHTALHLQHLIRCNLSLIYPASQEIHTDLLEINGNSVFVKCINAFFFFSCLHWAQCESALHKLIGARLQIHICANTSLFSYSDCGLASFIRPVYTGFYWFFFYYCHLPWIRKKENKKRQGLLPCAAKYPLPRCVSSDSVLVKALLSVNAHFVILGLVTMNSKSVHLLWLSRDQWYRRYKMHKDSI